MDVVSHLRGAGFDDQEISDYMQQTRDHLKSGGFSDQEVDDYFGQPQTPANVPDALSGRLAAGTEARKREGGLVQTIPQFASMLASPDGRTKLWNAVKQFPQDFVEGLKLPGEVMKGEVDLDTPEGMNAAVGFGAMIGLTHGAPGAPTMMQVVKGITREIAPSFLRSGGKAVTITRDAAGNVYDQPVGGLPTGEDFANAGRAIGNGDSTPLMEQKLQALYQGHGLHPAEVAADAARDPVVAQEMLSVDPGDIPYGQAFAGYGGLDMEFGYQFHGYDAEGIPEKLSDLAQRLREAGIPTTVQEPYFKDITKGARAKFDELPPLGRLPLGDIEPPADIGLPPGEDFRVPEDLGTKEELREKVLLEGKDVEYNEAQKQVLAKIDSSGEAPKRTLTWGRAYTNLLDKYFPLPKQGADATELTAENNPYVLARLMAGWAGKANHFLRQGTFEFKTGKNNGPSLEKVLEPIADDINGFNAYGVASRALELENRGIKSGFGENLDELRSILINGRDKYEAVFRNVVDYQNRVFTYLRDSGVISNSIYVQSLALNKMMFPFARVMGYEEGAPMNVGGSLQARNPIHKIKGSGRDLISPVESIVRNTYHLIEMAERNNVSEAAVKALTELGKAFPKDEPLAKALALKKLENADAIAEELRAAGVNDPEGFANTLAHAAQPDEPGHISVMRDGERFTYETDPDIARAMKALNPETANWIVRVLSAPANMLRAGAVMTPEFWGRHIVRDFVYASIRGDINITDYPRAILGLLTRDQMYWDWLRSGGGNVSVASLSRRFLQEDLRQLTKDTGVMTRAWNVMSDPESSMWQKTGAAARVPFDIIGKYVLDPLRTGTEFAENISHFAAFRRAMMKPDQALPAPRNLREQITRAGWISRDTAVDAARMGAAMKAYNAIFAFGNIKLQDSDVIAGAIKRSPAKTLTKIALGVTLPSVALWALNHDDPDYNELPDWQKWFFWVVPIGSEAPSPLHVQQARERGEAPTNSAMFFMRIPKPWATGLIFGSLPERLLEAYKAERPNVFKDFFKNFYEAVGPDWMPTAVAPIYEQWANRSWFTNRTLIPRKEENFLPEYQYTPYTTELTKQLGQAIGSFPGIREIKDQPMFGPLSTAVTNPILMENYIRGWTGTLGVYTLNIADAALRNIGILPDPVLPTRTLADIPFIKAFIARYPSATTESIQSFRDRYANNKSYYDTWMNKAKEGDIAAMQHIQQLAGPAMFLQLNGISQALSAQQKLVQDIYKNPNIQPDQKRQLIDKTYYTMIQTAQYGNRILDAGERAIRGGQP